MSLQRIPIRYSELLAAYKLCLLLKKNLTILNSDKTKSIIEAERNIIDLFIERSKFIEFQIDPDFEL